ncbi:MAG: ABC transporter ATP-binding protein [Ruminococcaceae bacterium]|nr:ABC transporter ATP-binding protein [Oscillospiraceae bacterium]
MSKRPRQRVSSILRNNLIMLGKIAKYTPDYFFLMIVEGVIWGLINSANAWFTYHLLNTVEAGTDFGYAVRIIAIMASFYLLTNVFDKWYWCIQNRLMRQRLHLRMHEELFIKARSLDLACFDDPEFYNDFVWAMNESDRRAVEVAENTGKLINRVVASATMFGLLLSVDPIIGLILFVSCVIGIVCSRIGNYIWLSHSKELYPLERKDQYVNRVYHLPDYAKELRISRADELLMREYDTANNEIIRVSQKYGKKYFWFYGVGGDFVGMLTVFFVLFYMIFKLDRGAITVGGFAASATVVFNVRWMLDDLITRLMNYPKYSLFIEKYLEFMRTEPQIRGEVREIPPFESLELRNVSFSYEFSAHAKYRFHSSDHISPKGEESEGLVLKNVSLKIQRGDKIAIVGYNGAGKTTLIKLMMRLYDPTEGEILYNGINIRQFVPEVYRERIGTVFQDYKLFAASIAENVMNGAYSPEDEPTVLRALAAADFTEKLETLPNGIHTPLTREFDEHGTNLSGGESQKIAIARVFASRAPIVIMDEPSSALDPMAEYCLNQSILQNTEDRTVIFISHRLSTTRIADRIYMFDRGELIEIGNHAELLAQHGKYAEMFEKQSEKYRTNSVP